MKSASYFKRIRNGGLIIAMLCFVVLGAAYAYVGSMKLMGRQPSASNVSTRHPALIHYGPPEIPEYVPYAFRTGLGPDMTQWEFDQLSGTVSGIAWPQIVLKVRTLSLRHSLLAPKDTLPEQLVKIVVNEERVEIHRNVGFYSTSHNPDVADRSELAVGQRITCIWERHLSNGEPFVLAVINIEICGDDR